VKKPNYGLILLAVPNGPDPFVPVHYLFGIHVGWYGVAAFVILLLCALLVAAKAK
jgi:hypothetical protein